MAPYYIPSKRGRNLLVNDGYIYNKHSSRKNNTYWVCKRKPMCLARITTTENPLTVVRVANHQHPADPDEVRALQLVHEVKKTGVDRPDAAPGQIVDQKLNDLPVEVLGHLPKRQAIKRTINRARQAELPPNPKDIYDLRDLPLQFRTSLAKETFLIYDSYHDSDDDDNPRIIIFATRENLRKLALSPTWFCDGTFKVCPTLFTQIFTIHGTFENVAFPFVYALLPNKTQASYQKVFQVIKSKCAEFHINLPEPDTIVSDFELAIINAARLENQHSNTRLCFFHLGQNVYNTVQDEGLQARYADPLDRAIKIGTHQLLSLAFVPLEFLEESFDTLLDELPDELVDVAERFEKTYIRGTRARGRRRATVPRYDPILWNQYVAAQQGEPRTNNLCEGWHRRFNSTVNKFHPSLYALLREFQKEQAATELMLRELSIGRAVREPQRKKYADLTERLKTISLRFNEYHTNGQIGEYLRLCGTTFAL